MRAPVLALLFLSACTGDIVGPGEVVDPGNPGTGGGSTEHATYDATFACDPAAATLAATPVRRLTKTQWLNALQDMFSRVAPADRTALFASAQVQIDQVPDDSSKYGARGDDVLAQAHSDAVFEVAVSLATSANASTQIVNAMASVCGAGSTRASLSTATCLKKFVDVYGQKAFRRPLTAAEETDLIAFYGSLGADGFAGLLGRLLAHPRLYYALDHEGAKVSGTDGVDAVYQLTHDELLAKLTFLFWEAPPDEAIVAATKNLDANATIDAVIADARTHQGVGSFYQWWLDLDSVPTLPSMSTAAFDAFAGVDPVGQTGHHHRDEMIQEVKDLGTHYALDTAGSYADLLTTRVSFAKGDDLANLYGVTKWSGSPTSLVTFPQGPRNGLLTRAAMLVSGSEYTRPIIKGKRIRFRMLCDELAPPPASLMIKPLVQDAAKSTRTLTEEATASATCQACHAQMNPLGFATEDFDSLGRARSMEQKLAADGHSLGAVSVHTDAIATLFRGDDTPVQTSAELAQHIVDSGRGQRCMVQQYFRYAASRAETAGDGCDLEAMRNKGSLKDMFTELVRRDVFQQRRVQ